MKPLLLAAVQPQDAAFAVSPTDPVAAAAGTDADGADSENVQVLHRDGGGARVGGAVRVRTRTQ